VSVLQGANSLSLMNASAGDFDVSKMRVFVLVSSNAAP